MTALLYPPPLRSWRLGLFLSALALMNVVALSNVPGYTVLVPYAAGSLAGVAPSFGTWATTDHMIGIALGLPFARWFAGRFGDYRVYAVSLLAYAVFAFACASSETIYQFVVARVALGFAGGIVLPIGQTLALKEVPEKLRTFSVGFWGILSMTPFTIGVFMGGWYAEYLGWRALFYSDIVVALLVAGLVAALLYGRGYRRVITRFDTAGFVLLAVILYGLQTIFNQGNDFDWFDSSFLAGALIAVAVSLPLFVIWELGARHPVLDLRLFAHRNYAIAVFCSVAGFLVIQGLLSVFIGQLQLLIGNTSSLAGLIYLTMLVCAAPFVAIMHEVNRRIDARVVSFVCFVGLSATFTWIGLFDKLASFDALTTPMLFFGLFIAAFFAPLAALGMHGLSGGKLLRAAEELALLRTAAGSFGITLMGVVQFRRTPLHQLDLADHVGGRRFASLDLLGQFSEKLQNAGVPPAGTIKQLAALTRQEASLLALNDAFLIGAIVFVALAAVIWFARPTPILPLRPERLLRLRAEELMEQP